MNSKKYFLGVLFGTILFLVILALPTISVDPYFHYRAPNGTYQLNNQRYQNDGIAKHFEYDALITGSSMVENFKTSEFDQLFGTNSIKLPYSGAHFLEIDNAINTALKSNSNLKIVLRSLDLNILDMEKDSMRYDSYPTYLYDNIWVNDVNYFFNKDVLLEATRDAIEWQHSSAKSTSFDEYCSWDINLSLPEQIDTGVYTRIDTSEVNKKFTDADRTRVVENINQNIVQTAKNNPDVTFYLFLPPCSCLYYDWLIRDGKWEYHIEVQRCAIEEMLKCENIKLFSFCDDYEITCNLENYRDISHYSSEISSLILQKIKSNDGLLTEDNYLNYLNNIKNDYLVLDRDSYFE